MFQRPHIVKVQLAGAAGASDFVNRSTRRFSFILRFVFNNGEFENRPYQVETNPEGTILIQMNTSIPASSIVCIMDSEEIALVKKVAMSICADVVESEGVPQQIKNSYGDYTTLLNPRNTRNTETIRKWFPDEWLHKCRF